MIRNSEIRDSLTDLVKEKAKLGLRVYYNHVKNASESYVWIRLRPMRRDEGYGRFERRLRVTMQVVLKPEKGEVRHSELYEIADALDVATNGFVQIGNRFITMLDVEALIYDDILTYTFQLDFADSLTKEEAGYEGYEKMKELKVRM